MFLLWRRWESFAAASAWDYSSTSVDTGIFPLETGLMQLKKVRKKEDKPCWHGPQTGLLSTHSHFKTLAVTQMWRGVISNFKSSSDAHPLKESVLLLAASPGRAPVGQEYTASSGISEEKERNFQNLRFCTQQEFPISLIWEMKNSRKH